VDYHSPWRHSATRPAHVGDYEAMGREIDKLKRLAALQSVARCSPSQKFGPRHPRRTRLLMDESRAMR
jgi:hypothetical protein